MRYFAPVLRSIDKELLKYKPVESPVANFLGIDPEIFNYFIVPLLIFCARVCDVSINTLRVILMMNGKRKIAPLIGFFESLIWLIAISQILKNVGSVSTYIAYAGGFSMGIFVGMLIEEKLAFGKVILRVITQSHQQELINAIKNNGFGITVVDAQGARGKVNLIFTVVDRKELKELIALIQTINPKAFYTIENVRHATDSAAEFDIDEGNAHSSGNLFERIKLLKKSK